MTTIAVNKDEIAADSQFTHQQLVTKGTKIYDVGGSWVAFCGDVESGMLFVRWKSGIIDRPEEISEDFEALELRADGKIFWYGSKLIPVEVKEKVTAVGSGSHLAIGAMMAGVSPSEAVKIACKVDVHSCAPVKKFVRRSK